MEHCGSAPYDILPATDLGAVVSYESMPDWELTAAELSFRIALTGDVGEAIEVVHGVRLWRYRYTTQDRGLPVEATGLIALPDELEGPQEGAWPVALMLHGFMGVTDACAPSADPIIGPALPAILATQGYAVIAPDYIGMAGMGDASTAVHAPLVGEQVAIGSWDAWRAGRALLEGDLARHTGEGLRDDLLIYGASQGGHAALFTELLGPYYAPEAEVLGVVAATPAHDLTSVAVDGVQQYTDRTGLTALTMVGMRRWYGTPETLEGVLTNNEPYFILDTVEELLALDAPECEIEVEFQASTVEEIYDDPYLSAARAEDFDAMQPWSCFFERSSVTTAGIPRLRDTPILTIYGELDTLVAPELQTEDSDRLCADGWQLERVQCEGADHVGGTLWALSEQLQWMEDRVAGLPVSGVCEALRSTCCSGSPAEVCTP